MARANVTISIPEEFLREVRHMAVDKGMSLSRFIALLLEEQVRSVKRGRLARERQLALLERGLELGTLGRAEWIREELHER